MLDLAFVDNQEQEQPSLPSPRLVKILKVNSWMKTYATSKNLFTERRNDNWSLLCISVNF